MSEKQRKEKIKYCPRCSAENRPTTRVCRQCSFRWILPGDIKPAAPVRKSLTHRVWIGFGWCIIVLGAALALMTLLSIRITHPDDWLFFGTMMATFIFIFPFVIGRAIIAHVKKKYGEDDIFEVHYD